MRKKKLHQDKNWLYKKYKIEKLSSTKIGKICNVSHQTILNQMNKLGIKTRLSSVDKLYREKNWLYQKYITEKFSTPEIGKICGVDYTQIRYWLIKYGIKRRSISEAKKGIPFTKEHKKKLSEARIGKYNGENCPSWKGGISSVNNLIRTSLECNIWKTAVFERDNYTCQNCGARSEKDKAVFLNAHHKKSFSKHPKLRFDVNNGITLCELCHCEIDEYRAKFMKLEAKIV